MKKLLGILVVVALSTGCSSLRMKSDKEVRELGEEAYSTQKYDEAQTYYDELLRRDEEDVDTRLKRGRSRDKTGNLLAAREDYSQALKVQPQDVRGRLYRAELSIRNGDHATAKADLQEIVGSGDVDAGDRVVALKFLGNIEVAKNNYPGAQGFYRQATTLGASSADPWVIKHVAEANYNLGQCLYLTKDFQESHERFTLYASMAKRGGLSVSPQDYYLLAITAYLSGDFQTASNFWDKADPQMRANAARVLDDPTINSKQFH
ncbi:MAG: tetratricopeptide repeat protein [Planctomycetota bacterium]|nr:tetratricopeptide repeat protein [Planctomycetota bacterium]